MKFDCGRIGLKSLLITAFVMVFSSSAQPSSRLKLAGIQVCKDKAHCVAAEIAATPARRMKGLMYRKSLPDSRGMLFVYPQSEYIGFWMKNTKMPLDIIWLDRSKRVVHIVRNAQPCMSEPCRTYVSREEAAYVLELASGMSGRWHLNIGDSLTFEVPEDVVSNVR